MGSGIAQIASTNKHDVVLYDSSSDSLKKSKEKGSVLEKDVQVDFLSLRIS